MHSPEETHPNENVTRTTASLLHSKGLGPQTYVTSAFVYGHNQHSGIGENSFLAESSLQLNRVAFYGRFENVGKSVEELVLQNQLEPESRVLTINTMTLGMNYRIAQHYRTDLVLGAQVTGFAPDKTLKTFYGDMPLSGAVYLRISPSLMTMRSMTGGMSMSGINHPRR